MEGEMRDVIFNKLLEISNISRYPKISQRYVESGSQHSTEIGLIGLYIIRDMLPFIKDYPDCKDLEIDASNLALKALLFDHTIDGYQVGGMSKEHKYYDYEIKSDLNLPFLYEPFHSVKDDSLESHIIRLADLLSVLRKCIIEVQSDNYGSMAPVAEELKDHLLFERERLNKSQTLPLGVRNYFMDSYGKCLMMLNDEIMSPPAPAPTPIPTPALPPPQEEIPIEESKVIRPTRK
jgi:hypothetical protein